MITSTLVRLCRLLFLRHTGRGTSAAPYHHPLAFHDISHCGDCTIYRRIFGPLFLERQKNSTKCNFLLKIRKACPLSEQRHSPVKDIRAQHLGKKTGAALLRQPRHESHSRKCSPAASPYRPTIAPSHKKGPQANACGPSARASIAP